MISKVLTKLARSFGKITGKEASDINSELSYSKGFDSASSVLANHNYKMGPKIKKDFYFMFDADNRFVMNAYLHGDYQQFAIKPANMVEQINEYIERKSKVINQMEAQHLWEQENES